MTHLLQSLQSAAKLAVVDGNCPAAINMERWAVTYDTTLEAVRKAFELAQSQASLTPRNYEEMDK